MKLNQIINEIGVWDGWRDVYNKFVPQFIEEAKNKLNYQDWNQEVFNEFFERSSGQCVSSLKQGYFTKDEKNKIKKNWNELSPLLKQIAESQEIPLWDVYKQIQFTIRKYTESNRKSATYRLIAGLQPQLLCTIVNEKNIRQLLAYLNKNGDPTENIPNYTGNWFKDSHAIFNFYKVNSNIKDSSQFMTYPWQTIVYFEEDFDKNKDRDMSEILNELDTIKELLKYKKQIILQGPPGTGKTRLAKELAKVLIGDHITKEKPSRINTTDIEKYLKVGLEIPSVKERAIYTITEITSNNVRVVLTGGKTYSPNFSDIKNWYANKKWSIKGEQTNQLDSYNAALAKYIHDNIEDIESKITFAKSNQFNLIQFHPSYTYEDFVRGIVSKPNENGEGILFKTENKIIAEFAEKALKNKINSQKEGAELSKEKWVHKQFEQFIYYISEDIEKKEKIELTESVYIVELDDDAFRYKGLEGWTKRGNRMLFNDIKQAYLDENSDRQDLIHNNNLSGLAKWHASYYIRVLDMFRKFLKDNDLNFTADNSEKENLKNYVLIIDEINRANLPSVLGELIYTLEYRDESIDSMYEYEGKREIILPSNLYIIGTMNTADRSVGHIDYAIRRRFAFMDILPKDLSDEKEIIFDTQLFQSVKELFTSDDYKTRSNYLSTEFEPKDVALGQSYFIDKTEDGGSMDIRLEYEIKPILREYIKDGILKESVREKIEQLSTTI